MTNGPPRGISGRWFAIGFLAFLIGAAIGGFLLFQRFQKVMSALETVRQAWPAAATALRDRYEEVERGWTSSESSDTSLSPEERLEWKRARAVFDGSTQYDLQSPAVRPLEQIYRRQAVARHRPLSSIEPPSPIANLVLAEQTLESLQSDTLGWWLRQLFRLNLPKPIYGDIE